MIITREEIEQKNEEIKYLAFELLEQSRKPGTKKTYSNNIILSPDGEFINKNNIDILAL